SQVRRRRREISIGPCSVVRFRGPAELSAHYGHRQCRDCNHHFRTSALRDTGMARRTWMGDSGALRGQEQILRPVCSSDGDCIHSRLFWALLISLDSQAKWLVIALFMSIDAACLLHSGHQFVLSWGLLAFVLLMIGEALVCNCCWWAPTRKSIYERLAHSCH